jgi:DNA-binding NtrC family response regulator
VKVLVIDDEREVCDLVGRVLMRAGFEVTTAPAGDVGLELLRDGSFGCVVVDKLMPGLGGLEVMAEVRRVWPALPVVLMTAHPQPFQLGDAQPDVVLLKPFATLDAVTEAVKVALENARTGTPLEALRDRVVAVVTDMAPGLKRRGEQD